MFETAEMSRITVAAPVSNMGILRIIADLCIHIEEYGNFRRNQCREINYL